jgi:hypothetical protein
LKPNNTQFGAEAMLMEILENAKMVLSPEASMKQEGRFFTSSLFLGVLNLKSNLSEVTEELSC